MSQIAGFASPIGSCDFSQGGLQTNTRTNRNRMSRTGTRRRRSYLVKRLKSHGFTRIVTDIFEVEECFLRVSSRPSRLNAVS